MTLQSMLKQEDDHECNGDGDTDCDICRDCGEHTSFCSECGLSLCCGSGAYVMD